VARNAKELFTVLSDSDREEVLNRAAKMVERQMTVKELRKAILGSQVALGKKMGIKQAAVSRLEHRSDMRLSTLKQIIGAMGGEMLVVAQFANRPGVSVNVLDALDAPTPKSKTKKAPREAESATPIRRPPRPGSSAKIDQPRQRPRRGTGK
jgi:Helix-turn-helix domain